MSAERAPSFDAFAAAAMPRLRRLAYAWCQDPHRADDLVQSALERVLVAWPRVRRTDDPFAYTRTTMVRLLISEQRRPWFRREVATGTLPESSGGRCPDIEGRLDLLTLIHRLPERQRLVMLLRFVEDLPIASAAATLKCSEGTIKSQTHAAMQTLRGWYAQELTHGAPR